MQCARIGGTAAKHSLSVLQANVPRAHMNNGTVDAQSANPPRGSDHKAAFAAMSKT
eukprot:CAMPEP_0206501806 /NCGR_PEP_ID=MMETSP0324_2-20121206/53562_1 /ASSEMBLY_ACC=CAM_ASM_000836 /TAXON_ID=2866 /ORGANISM="Crypthecodinium cohnii, Strain Seligo" /LENGTH=55 /DNA_ID=CAMNT_0053989761 /DNA_START=212 /DNA_END=376 /DNA_ORIENTATION=-